MPFAVPRMMDVIRATNFQPRCIPSCRGLCSTNGMTRYILGWVSEVWNNCQLIFTLSPSVSAIAAQGRPFYKETFPLPPVRANRYFPLTRFLKLQLLPFSLIGCEHCTGNVHCFFSASEQCYRPWAFTELLQEKDTVGGQGYGRINRCFLHLGKWNMFAL